MTYGFASRFAIRDSCADPLAFCSGCASANSILSTRSELASDVADARFSECADAWNNRASASFDAASDAAHATTRRAEGEQVTAQRTRSKRCLPVSIGQSVSARSRHTHNAKGTPLSPGAGELKLAETPRSAEASEDAAYDLKAGDFTLKFRPVRRPISQAARSAALSIAPLGYIARACVLIWPHRPRSTVTVQKY